MWEIATVGNYYYNTVKTVKTVELLRKQLSYEKCLSLIFSYIISKIQLAQLNVV